MGNGVRLGRVAGVEVRADWTTLIAIGLITWTLAGNILPGVVEGAGTGQTWLVAVAATAAFYASLVAHELAHAVVANHHGVPVERITLWIFGGVASLEADAPTARIELRIALAGPATSVAIGAAALAVAALGAALGLPDLAVAGLAWLGVISVFLAVFNLLPAFPLDGGRVLRAVLWSHWGDRIRATTSAATAGRVFAYVLMGLGMVDTLTGGGIGGLWLVFLGWFLLAAAQREGMAVTLHAALAHRTVAQVMSANPVTVPPDLRVAELTEAVWANRYTAFPVVDGLGRPLGIVDLHDIRRVPRDRWPLTSVAEVMTPLHRVPIAAPDEPADVVIGRVGRYGQRRALVIDGGRLVGLVSATDLTRLLSRTELVRP
jgi:Zn-dependent protease